MRFFSPPPFLLHLIKWLLSLGMLAYVLHEIDLQQMLEMLTQQSPLIVLAGAAIFCVQLAIASWRWRDLLSFLSAAPIRPRYLQLLELNFISCFFNSCLPGTIGGDVVRSMLLKSEEFPLTICVHSVIIDRLLAVAGIFVMVMVLLPQLGELLPSLPVLPILLGVGGLVPCGLWLLTRLPTWLARLHSTRLLRLTIHLTSNLKQLVFTPKILGLTLLQSILIHASYCLACALFVHSLGGEISLLHSLTLIPPVILLTVLPISVGGWGMREVGMVGFLALAGVSKPIALAVSVQMGLLSILCSLPAALLYAKRKKL